MNFVTNHTPGVGSIAQHVECATNLPQTPLRWSEYNITWWSNQQQRLNSEVKFIDRTTCALQTYIVTSCAWIMKSVFELKQHSYP